MWGPWVICRLFEASDYTNKINSNLSFQPYEICNMKSIIIISIIININNEKSYSPVFPNIQETMIGD